jgi:transposase
LSWCELFASDLPTASQGLADWIGAHVNGLSAIGGVPRQIVSDNLKSGITKACFYEPTINRTYADMAAHYRTAIIPARPRKPRDKALASYCTLFRCWSIDRRKSRRSGAAASAAFEDRLIWRQFPEAAALAVIAALPD